MKFLREALSSFINLIFASNDPKENEQLRNWWEIILVFSILGLIAFIMAATGIV